MLVTGVHIFTFETISSYRQIPALQITPLFMPAHWEGQDCVTEQFCKFCDVDRKECGTSSILRAETRVRQGGAHGAKVKAISSLV